jgi:hypothetical protein
MRHFCSFKVIAGSEGNFSLSVPKENRFVEMTESAETALNWRRAYAETILAKAIRGPVEHSFSGEGQK